jgi:hypothetical protein
MIANRIAIVALASAALAFPAMAQDRVKLDDLDADRLNSRQVLIEFEYDGGACEEVGEAQLGDVTDGTLAVTLQIASTAEVCTMQLVEHEIKEAIPAGPDVTRVEVTLLAPDGQVMAVDTTEVDKD